MTNNFYLEIENPSWVQRETFQRKQHVFKMEKKASLMMNARTCLKNESLLTLTSLVMNSLSNRVFHVFVSIYCLTGIRSEDGTVTK